MAQDKPLTVGELIRTLQTLVYTGVPLNAPVVIDTEDMYGRSKNIGSLCSEHSVRLPGDPTWRFTSRNGEYPVDAVDEERSVVAIRPVRRY